jgi:hypothetical protein
MKTNLTAHNLHSGKRLLALALMVCAGALALLCAQAVIVGPYSVDGGTLHLWHLDKSTVPAVDSVPGETNLTAVGFNASLGNASYSGFGTALSTANAGLLLGGSPRSMRRAVSSENPIAL